MIGISIKNDYGSILIDSNWDNMVFLGKTLLTSLPNEMKSFYYYTPHESIDTSLYSQYNGTTKTLQEYSFRNTSFGGSAYVYKITLPANCKMFGISYGVLNNYVCIMEQVSNTRVNFYTEAKPSRISDLYVYFWGDGEGVDYSDRIGIKVRNADNKIVYSSSKRYLNICGRNDTSNFNTSKSTYAMSHTTLTSYTAWSDFAIIPDIIYYSRFFDKTYTGHDATEMPLAGTQNEVCAWAINENDKVPYNIFKTSVFSYWKRSSILVADVRNL